jgi:putative hydrolase of the HAD superfamily
VFDLDDTLRSCVHDYSKPIVQAALLIIEKLGYLAPHITAIINLEDELDKRRITEINLATGKPFAFSKERFPGSLVATYRELCFRAEIEPKEEIEKEIYNIGLKAFDPCLYTKENLFPDSISTLNFLRSKYDQIILLTKGDKQIQRLKLSALDAGNIFTRVFIVDNKTPEVFRKIVKGFENYNLFSVGDNYNSDIAPALKVGYFGVWIPRETWDVTGQLNEIRSYVDWSKCVELKSLKELVQKYDALVELARGKL